jgi:N-methylhydantoinase B/oxoprolinase/acetone carboxylase alpha subunit
VTTGGGGYGPVALRDLERTLADVELGYISPARAGTVYEHPGTRRPVLR